MSDYCFEHFSWLCECSNEDKVLSAKNDLERERDYKHLEYDKSMRLEDLGDDDYLLSYEVKCWRCGYTNHPGIHIYPTRIENFKRK